MSPRRLALKLCSSVQIIVSFLLGILILHDLTTPPNDGYEAEAGLELRLRLSALLLPVRMSGSTSTVRTLQLAAGFWLYDTWAESWRMWASWRGGRLRTPGRVISATRVVLGRSLPLLCAAGFLRWRRHARTANLLRGSSEGAGLGFPDLLAGLALCAQLPVLLTNTRWVVHVMEPQQAAHGSVEAKVLDAAIALNGLVCRCLFWPFVLLLAYRRSRGGFGIEDDKEPDLAAIMMASLADLPLRFLFTVQGGCLMSL